MSYKDIDIKSCYESGVNDIVEEFYEPVLSESVRYDRIAGFFSSSSLAVASRGISNFINRGGKMRLIASPVLDPKDYDIIRKIILNENISVADLGIDLDNLENEFISNHVKALGWMLSNGLLEIKLAVIAGDDGAMFSKETLLSSGLFHQKVGILVDSDNNKLSFSGSINETASAWINNDEEFKVFKEWDDSVQYYQRDVDRFDNLWKGQKKNVKVYDLPTAIKDELVKYGRNFDLNTISINKYISEKRKKNPFEYCGISLFSYQKNALNKWKQVGYRMLFEMATGTGKTRTALAGMKHMFSRVERLITIIACPQNTLARQWMDEIDKLKIEYDWIGIIDGTNPKWTNDLQEIILKNGCGFADHCIICTTHATSSSEKFISILCQNIGLRTELLLIGDEVHWLGASKLQKALLPEYKYRIGLSATPSRWFDDKGTRLLEDYFGNSHFEFTIKDALTKINPLSGKHFLVNYYYHIKSIGLNEDESVDYCILTEKISRLSRMKDEDPEIEEQYNRLLEKRADIIKNAENKYEIFTQILDDLDCHNQLDNLIIFVSPQQREKVLQILQERNIVAHQLTQEEGTRLEAKYGGLSERQYIIKLFKQGVYKALVAIKCLDEGIDIPSACRGILLASSTNPREYVQRIGRIIRQDDKKTFAYLYDICVDSVDSLDDELMDIERRIRMNEQKRLQEIASNAINSVEAMSNIFKLN